MTAAPLPALSFAAPFPLARLAEHYGGAVDPGAGALLVGALAPVESAAAGQLAPFVARRYLQAARASSAALLVDGALTYVCAGGSPRVSVPVPDAFVDRILAFEKTPPARG